MPDQTRNDPESLASRSEQREGRLWRVWTTEPKLLIGLAALVGAITAVVSIFVNVQPNGPQSASAPAESATTLPTETTDSVPPPITATHSEPALSPTFSRKLTLPPPPDSLSYSSIDIAAGRVAGSGLGTDEVYYEVSDSGKYRLSFSAQAAVLTDQDPNTVAKESCVNAIQSNPLSGGEPVRQLTRSTLICVGGSDGGVALLEVLAPPGRRGALAVRETYWEA